MKREGDVGRVESFPVQDSGKSDAETWEAEITRENMLTALKGVESNKGAAGIELKHQGIYQIKKQPKDSYYFQISIYGYWFRKQIRLTGGHSQRLSVNSCYHCLAFCWGILINC